MLKNTKNNFVNKDNFFLNLLLILCSIIFIQRFNFWFLLLLLISCLIINLIQFTKATLFSLIFVLIILLLIIFIPKEWKLTNLAKILNTKLGEYSLRNQMVSYIDSNYSSNSKVFLKMLLLNYKDYKDSTYKIFVKLNIIHLFIISGFHLSIINKFFSIIFKNKILNFSISLITNLFFFYITNFSISVLRIILVSIIKLWSKAKINNFRCNIFCAIFIVIFFTRDAQSFTFILMFICVLFLSYINNKISNRFLKWIIIVSYLNILTAPISIYFNDSFNILSFFNNLIFNNIVVIIFFFELFFCWFPFVLNFNETLISYCLLYFEKIANTQTIINISLCDYSISLFYFINIFIYEFYEWCGVDKLFKKNLIHMNK